MSSAVCMHLNWREPKRRTYRERLATMTPAERAAHRERDRLRARERYAARNEGRATHVDGKQGIGDEELAQKIAALRWLDRQRARATEITLDPDRPAEERAHAKQRMRVFERQRSAVIGTGDA